MDDGIGFAAVVDGTTIGAIVDTGLTTVLVGATGLFGAVVVVTRFVAGIEVVVDWIVVGVGRRLGRTVVDVDGTVVVVTVIVLTTVVEVVEVVAVDGALGEATTVVDDDDVELTETTVIEIVKVPFPDALVAVTTKLDVANVEVGVPEITPVDASIVNPAGRDGATDHEDAAPPVFVGVKADIALLTVRFSVAVVNVIDGAAKTPVTEIETTKVSLPAELVAVTV